MGEFSYELDDLIRRSYETSCSHGFHETYLSDEHMLMLVMSEVGEMVDASRHGRRASLCSFDDAIAKDRESKALFKESFEKYVKDSIEDEMADVVIRLFDFCGLYDLRLHDWCIDGTLKKDDFINLFSHDDFPSKCYHICDLLTHMELDDETMGEDLEMTLSYIFHWSEFEGIDLMRHVHLKMRYNEMRPYKNGKVY